MRPCCLLGSLPKGRNFLATEVLSGRGSKILVLTAIQCFQEKISLVWVLSPEMNTLMGSLFFRMKSSLAQPFEVHLVEVVKGKCVGAVMVTEKWETGVESLT